ncbi:MAG: COG4705 family protein [Candidatus Limnocylindrales bacterium]
MELVRPRSGASMGRKVPEITLTFWVLKVLTTAMGEVTSDYLVRTFNPVLVVPVAALVLGAALLVQLRSRRYVPWIYWLAVAMVAIFGTMAADVLHIELGIPYLVSTVFFAAVLAFVFGAWQMLEGTLSIHRIDSRRRELFYWATVLTTFALGTATGDMTATTLRLGYLDSGILFAILFVIPALGYRFSGLNAVIAFWLAYILTRPFGASFADWVGRPQTLSGLGFGTGQVSLVLGVLIVALVASVSIARPKPAG